MAKEEILGKIDELMNYIFGLEIKEFEQRDVVYLLVEMYKIKERDLELDRGEITKVFPHISFFRDWVVHTHLNKKEWVENKNTLNNTDALLSEILSIIESEETKEKVRSVWQSFESSLLLVTKDQDIFEKAKVV